MRGNQVVNTQVAAKLRRNRWAGEVLFVVF